MEAKCPERGWHIWALCRLDPPPPVVLTEFHRSPWGREAKDLEVMGWALLL